MNIFVSREDSADPGSLLWELIFSELQKDAIAFKARIFKLYHCIASGTPLAIFKGTKLTMEDIHEANYYTSWDSDEFVGLVIMYLSTAVGDVDHKTVATAHTREQTKDITQYLPLKRVFLMSTAYEMALLKVERGKCLVIAITLTDYALPPSSTSKTFSRIVSMVISLSGVYIFQAFPGPRGYTLQHYMTSLMPSPLTHTQGREYVNTLTMLMKLSVDNAGRWTMQANALYQQLFFVDLIEAGMMDVGVQFDPLLTVEMHECNIGMVYDNFGSLLPICRLRREVIEEAVKNYRRPYSFKPLEFLCDYTSRKFTESHASESHPVGTPESPKSPMYHRGSAKLKRDSTTTRIRRPKFIDYPAETGVLATEPLEQLCAYCKFSSSNGILTCSRCKLVPYCCGEHQTKHWKIHKDHCISTWADFTTVKNDF